MTGGLRTMMHNDLAEEIADRMKDAGCRDVMLEPDLIPVDGEAFELKTANKQDDARSDIRAEGFWGKKRRSSDDWVACWLSVRRCRSQISWDGSVLDCRSQSCALLSHACVGVGA